MTHEELLQKVKKRADEKVVAAIRVFKGKIKEALRELTGTCYDHEFFSAILSNAKDNT